MEQNDSKKYLIQHFGFTENDFQNIHSQGYSLEKIVDDIAKFQEGVSKTILERPATVADGIKKYSQEELTHFKDFFDSKKSNFRIKKFVPASGAASRMFKFLSEFLNSFNPDTETLNAYINKHNEKNLLIFLAGIEKFPFYEEIKTRLKAQYPEYYSLESHEKSYRFIKMMLDENQCNFANKPKAILDFHKYHTHIATPIEEHLRECAHYANSQGKSNLHFTISEQHQDSFERLIKVLQPKIEEQTGVTTQVQYSYQNKATDSIAVTLDNVPYRDSNNNLLFRPGGHGALLYNLNRLESDVIFIKNIDNVIQNHLEEISFHKKALAGILLTIQEKIFSILERIDNNLMTENDLEEVISFMKNELNIFLYEGFEKYTFENKIDSIKRKLNRPIRICGMVKNEGEPGGGPFWVRSKKGNLSLQIVENNQIDTENASQVAILNEATHFNPVDIVCGIKDFKGNKFELDDFVDHETGFIVQKNKNGTPIKSYELPGLWNGAMARWITVFVEVPLITFNPVKTVNDLLKPAHQPLYEEK